MTFDSKTGSISFASTDTQTYSQPMYHFDVRGTISNQELEIPVSMSLINPCESEELQFALPEVFDLSEQMTYFLGDEELIFNWTSDEAALTD